MESDMQRILFASLAMLTLGTSFASAQTNILGQPPFRARPIVSPFVNLGQGNVGAYYGIVRPQVDAYHSITELQQGLQRLPAGTPQGQLDQQTTTSALGGLQTGHSVTFFNTGSYYPAVPGSVGNPSLGAGTPIGGFNTSLGTGVVGYGGLGVRTFYGGALAQPLIR
jgi:hypothetical protein